MIAMLQTDHGAGLREHLQDHRVVAIVRADAVADPIRLVTDLAGAGIGSVEFTLTTPGALEMIAATSAIDGCRIGVGTVTTAAQVRDAARAGASFAVTPAQTPEMEMVSAECQRLGVALIAGAMTPSEIVHAAGLADLVKVFPARRLGPEFISDVLQPFPGLALVPSGGIALDEVPRYLAAGAAGVGVGSLLSADDLRSGDHTAMLQRAHRLVAAIDAGATLT
jgi:2-dehydro-3-deoxyphosphogluconate aldolase/(4S)-4-hydroxy-2-oxoglutarate aldolase